MLTVGAAETVASRTLRPALTVDAGGVPAIGSMKPAMFTKRANAIAIRSCGRRRALVIASFVRV
eukprot:scaffold87654_cov69-Phaeocystis_antarctica.AAC.8